MGLLVLQPGEKSGLEAVNDRSIVREIIVALRADGKGVLHLWLGHAARNGGQAQLAWSPDHGRTWLYADWQFKQFGLVGFINFGQDDAGARDAFVYCDSHDLGRQFTSRICGAPDPVSMATFRPNGSALTVVHYTLCSPAMITSVSGRRR